MKVLDALDLIEAGYANNLGSNAQVKPPADGAQAFLMRDGTLVIPGTNELSDWTKYNLNLFNRTLVQVSGGYRFHSGFLQHANLVLRWARDKQVKRVTGHSLGAASGQILGAILGVPAINFASPRVSLWRYRYKNENRIINFNRDDDRVAKVPRIGFRHLGRVEWISQGSGNLGGDHSLDHYKPLLAHERYAGLPQIWV